MREELDKIREYCGVFGVSCNDFSHYVAGMIYSGLMAIQHRGRLSSGISMTNCDGKIVSFSDIGLVSKVLTPTKLKSFTGNVGIGHVGYEVPRGIKKEDIQPYYFRSDKSRFSIAMNGTFTNSGEMREKLRNLGRVFIGNSDVELIATLIDSLLGFSNDIIQALKSVLEIAKGAYSLLLMTSNGNLYAIKDPNGYKPLCHGIIQNEERKFYVISSESCAIDAIGGELLGEIKPGQIIEINPKKGMVEHQGTLSREQSICFYEYAYFARPDSIIEGISVADARYRLGRCLAKNDTVKLENAIVVPVPDSGRSAAMGYAWESNLSYVEGLMKNRYIWQLKSNPREKLNPIKSLIKSKNIILIDDSILSGDTLQQIIKMLREAGAKEIHARISCPPIIHNCMLNDSLWNKTRLIALEKELTNYEDFNENMKNYIGADSLIYLSIESLIKAIGLDKNKACLKCLLEYRVLEDENQEENSKNLKQII